MDLETPHLTTGEGPLAGTLVELVLAVSDELEDVWAIGDRLDTLISSGRAELSALG